MAQNSQATVDPVVLPDVATGRPFFSVEPIPPKPDVGDNSSEAGETKLQDLLPEINELAQKVGGFKKLSEIADTLDKMGR